MGCLAYLSVLIHLKPQTLLRYLWLCSSLRNSARQLLVFSSCIFFLLPAFCQLSHLRVISLFCSTSNPVVPVESQLQEAQITESTSCEQAAGGPQGLRGFCSVDLGFLRASLLVSSFLAVLLTAEPTRHAAFRSRRCPSVLCAARGDDGSSLPCRHCFDWEHQAQHVQQRRAGEEAKRCCYTRPTCPARVTKA